MVYKIKQARLCPQFTITPPLNSKDIAFSLTCLMSTDAHLQEKLAWQCIYSVHTGGAINATPFLISNCILFTRPGFASGGVTGVASETSC